MATYLVDTENVGHAWVSYAKKCVDGHKCILFFTSVAPNPTFSEFASLMPYANRIECIECYRGNNALDFQLATELGYRIHRSSKEEYIVVSNDTGFDVVVRYWKKRGVKVSRENTVLPVQTPQSKARPRIELYIEKLGTIGIDRIMGEEIARMVQISARAPEKDWMSRIYVMLIQKYGQKKGLNIYRNAKPTLITLLMDAGKKSLLEE